MSAEEPSPNQDTPQRPVRMVDIAESLGISRATVSLVMTGSPLVAEHTREAVLQEAERLGYVYHRGAASLRSRRSDVVGFVMPDVVNPLVAELSIGAQDVLAEHGYFAMIANTQDDFSAQQHVIRTLTEQRVAGIITITVLHDIEASIADLTRTPVPVVLLVRNLPGSGLPFVGPDERKVGRIGAQHLLEHGCRTVAYFGGPAATGPRIEREKSFRRAIGRKARIVPEWEIPFPPRLSMARETASRLLATGPPPEGVLCHSDSAAYGLQRALYEHGLGPGDCRIVGIDDLQFSDARVPSLSTVAVDPIELGRISARQLLKQIGHDVDPGRPPAPRLMARESCGCVPPPDGTPS